MLVDPVLRKKNEENNKRVSKDNEKIQEIW